MRKNRSKKHYRKAPRKRKQLTKHHDFPKARGGTWDNWNIYQLSEDHHRAYHKLFGLRTFSESARVLMRMETLHREHLNAPTRSPDMPSEHRAA